MTRKSQTEVTSATEAPINALSDLQKAGFGNMLGMGTAWMEALGEMNAEVVSFLADRIKEDVKTQHEILHCKDIGQLQRIQSDFIEKAMEQYQAETGKLVEMGKSVFTAQLDAENGKTKR